MKRGLKRALSIAAILFGVLVALPIAATFALPLLFPAAKVVVGNPPLAEVRDGNWEGTGKVLPVSARVRVKVEGGRILAIDLLEHVNGKGKPGEAVIPRVMERQGLDVDVVAGATYSSKAILKAIEAALVKGRIK